MAVLVVDDHADTRSALNRLLASEGYDVIEAADGREALDVLVLGAPVEPCLLMLDLKMPVMGGWELLAIIKSYHRLAQIPVLVISGADPLNSDAMNHGTIDGYITKPYDTTEILAKVKQCARRAR